VTTFEHAMLGINGALAAGLHGRYEWRVAALAGMAAIAPDWNGLTILGGVELFDHAHRAWVFWPFSSRGFVFPLVRWGDIGVTIIFVVSMFAMIRKLASIQAIALITLTLVLMYIVVRGTLLT
jgi:hypothetical protein